MSSREQCVRILCLTRINALLEAINFTLVMSTPIVVAIAGFATFVLTVRPVGSCSPNCCQPAAVPMLLLVDEDAGAFCMPHLMRRVRIPLRMFTMMR